MQLHAPKVDMRSQASVLAFLEKHPRYSTMSSVNRCTSFSQCIKIHNIALNSDPRIQALDAKFGRDTGSDTAYALLGVTDIWYEFASAPIEEFTAAMGYRFTIGNNGRSGGYLVLYNSFQQASEHKSHCVACGQRNFQAVPTNATDPNANKCGRCGATGEDGRRNYLKPLMTLQTWPGRPIGEDLDELSFSDLKELARVVLAFDATCRQIRENFIKLVLSREVVDETILVRKTIRVTTARSAKVAAHA